MVLNNRLKWVETLKFIGIIAVVLGHISSPLGSFIYSWHMPFFFILAGFFIKVDLSPLLFFKKEFIRLMIPYLIFSLFAICVESLKRIVLNREMLDWFDLFQGTFLWMDMSSLSTTYAFVLWFLPALLFARYFVYLTIRFIPTQWLHWILLSFLFFVSLYIELPFALDEALNALLFVYIGWILYRSNYNVFPFILAAIFIYYFYGFIPLDMASKYYEYPLANVVWAVSFSYILVMAVKKLDFSFNLIELWGANTMLLFIIHPYTNNAATLIVNKYFGEVWLIKLLISLLMLQCVIILKMRYKQWRLFRYV